MAVKLRLSRLGRKHRAFFRLHVFDSRTRRNGRAIEDLGFYDPIAKDSMESVKLNRERIEYWLSQGAQMSPTVASLLKKNGVTLPAHATK